MDFMFQLSVICRVLVANSWLIDSQYGCLTYALRNAALQQIEIESNYDHENYSTIGRCRHASL